MTAYNLSNHTFMKTIHVIMKAPLSWFDKTPTGRILNRMTKDQTQIDHYLVGATERAFWALSCFVSNIIMLCYFNPNIFIIIAITGQFYWFTFSYCLEVKFISECC